MRSNEVEILAGHQTTVTEGTCTVDVTSGPELDVSVPEQVIEITQSGTFTLHEYSPNNDGYMSDTRADTTRYGGLVAVRGFLSNLLSWIETDVPHRHKLTRIFRSKTEDFNASVCVGDSQTQTFTDVVEPGINYYYWLVGETYAGKRSIKSEVLRVEAIDIANDLSGILGLEALISNLENLEERLNVYVTQERPDLEDMLSDNLATVIAMINDSIITVTRNMIEIEGRIALANDGSYALLQDQLSVAVDTSNATIERLNSLTAKVNSDNSENLAEISRLDLVQVSTNEALSSAREELSAKIDNETNLREASVSAERTARVNAVEVVASSVESFKTIFENELTTTNAAIDSERIARTNTNAAIASTVSDISTGFDTARTELDARITQQANSQATATEAVSNKILELDSKVSSSISTLEANINEELETYTDEFEAVSGKVLELSANFEGLNDTLSTVNATISSESETRANEDAAIANSVTALSTKMDTDIGLALARAEDFTESRVGYCIKYGQVTEHTDAQACELSGGTWQKLPLSTAIDKVSVSYSDSNGINRSTTAGTFFQSLVDDVGNVSSRAWLGVNDSNRVVGINVQSSSGAVNSGEVDIIADTFTLTHPDSLQPILGFNTSTREGYFKGRLVLGDGTNINSVEDIKANDGKSAVYGTWEHPDGFSAVQEADGSWDSKLKSYVNSYFKFYSGSTLISSGRVQWGVSDDRGTINLHNNPYNLAGDSITYEISNDMSSRVTLKITHNDSNVSITQDFYSVKRGPAGTNGSDGVDGSNGASGPGFYAITNSTGTFPSNATATSDFRSRYYRDPLPHDHLTYVNSTNTRSTIKKYTGNSWVAPSLVVNGDILTSGSVTAKHIQANSISADKIDVNSIFARNITATGTISGAELYGAKVSTSSSSSAFRATLEDDNKYIFWIGEGSKTDANGTFWIKKNGTGYIKGAFFQGELVESKGASTEFSGGGPWTVTANGHKSAGKPVKIDFAFDFNASFAGNQENARITMTAKILRNGALVDTKTFHKSPALYNELNQRTSINISGQGFVLDEASAVNTRGYTLKIEMNTGSANNFYTPEGKLYLITNETKLSS